MQSPSPDPSVVSQVAEELGRYVYILVDPRDSTPFYVGKGQGSRLLAHGWEADLEPDPEDGEKIKRIRDIRRSGAEPEIWIARYALNKGEYTAVEAALIDALQSFPVQPTTSDAAYRPLGHMGLTNGRREKARDHGMTLLQSFIDEYAAPQLTTETPLLLITLNGWTDLPDGETIAGGRVRYGAGYKPEWLTSRARREAYAEIGESVSAWWTINTDRVEWVGIEHVVAVHRGVTRALLKVEPGSWETVVTERLNKAGNPIRKSAFWFTVVDSGPLFDEVVGPHGHRVLGKGKGAQNSIYYWPR